MRITSFMLFDQMRKSFQNNLGEMSGMYNKLSSGKKIGKPSDDVIGMMRAMDHKLSINYNEQYKRTIDDAVAHINFAETITSSVSNALVRAKELALSGATGTASAETRASISKEVAQLRDQILSLSNSKLGDRYMFSGLRTDTQPFNSTTFNYQGDSGIINVMIDKKAVMPINVPGSDVFSYTLSAEDVIQLSDGKYVHYIPGAGTTINVEIRDTDDTTVLDSFSFSNFIQMTDVLNSALKDNNLLRIEGILKPLDNAHNQAINIQADTGGRLNRLNDQKTRLDEGNLNLKTLLSNTEDADMAEIASELAKAEAVLQALRQSSARVLSQSLLDFLR